MSKIKAYGKLVGVRTAIEVEIKNGKLELTSSDFGFDVIKKEVEKMLRLRIETAGPVGGTYYPPKETLLAAYLGLNNNFFDDKDYEIEVVGKLEAIPSRKGVVY